MSRFWWLVFAPCLLGAGCRTGSTVDLPGDVTYAAVATAGARFRADAGCYAVCTGGSVCNHATGYCCQPGSLECQDADPCGGRCTASQSCDANALVPHCVPFKVGADAGTSFSR